MRNKEQKNERVLNNNLLPFITNEDPIYLNRCAIPRDQASEEIYKVAEYMKLYNEDLVGFIPVEKIIGPTKFLKLYSEAMKLYNNQPHYITAVKIKITADDNELKLIYQPILLTRSSIISNSSKIAEYQIIEGNSEFIYCSTSKDFIDVPTSHSTYATKYQNNIRIKRNPDEDYSAYVYGVDTEYAIFSFQEILTMIIDNPNVNRFLIFNCIKEHSNDPISSIRNSLIFSPNIWPTFEKDLGPFLEMYGNLAHLCPPNCNSLRYKLLSL